ncbi:hypothetical protein FO519_005189 [Halicephalobus sp. NKZ332]|nr:hypothetical protein FO519_005189 [Halicephalobus sp. NKZ332]
MLLVNQEMLAVASKVISQKHMVEASTPLVVEYMLWSERATLSVYGLSFVRGSRQISPMAILILILGIPLAKFSGCDMNRFFHNHSIIFDITFCGDWAGGVWSSESTCSGRASSCIDYVKNNPVAFKDVYWLISSLKVYSNDGGSSPQRGSLISIKCSNGKFVSTEDSNGPMTCNRDQAQDWEQLRYSGSNGKFRLQSKNGKYCSSENGHNPMICNRDTAMEWEEFTQIWNGDGTFSIKCNNGRFLSSEGGNGPMNCNRENIDAWDRFRLIQL